MDPNNHSIGRFARVIDCSDKDWLDAHIKVVSYDAKDSTYEVMNERSSTSIHLRIDQLNFYSPKPFLARFPNAPVVQGRHDMMNLPIASVVAFSNADRGEATPPNFPPLEINGSCRVVGRPVFQKAQHTNTINNKILIKAGNNDFVEFENVYCQRRDGHGWVMECVGGNIVFRNCVFVDCRSAVVVGYGVGGVNVFFEGCTFLQVREQGVLVDEGDVTMVECKFRGVGAGVVVKGDASINLKHCSFSHSCVLCVFVTERGEASVNDCQFQEVLDNCIHATKGAIVHSARCFVDTCPGKTVLVDGRRDTDVTITDWHFVNCTIGVEVSGRKITANLHNNTFELCGWDIYIALDVAGMVDISHYDYNPEDVKYINGSTDQSQVWLNDVQQQDTQVERLRDNQRKRHFIHEPPRTGTGMLALSRAEIEFTRCAQCDATAPISEIFRKCARCVRARYCSRVCQKVHWPAHHMRCSVDNHRYFQIRNGYIPCENCGKVEVLSAKVEHSACSRCLRALYCSKICQKEHWKQHKPKCVETRKIN